MTAPVKKIRAGSVSCALWENEVTMNGKSVKLLRATVERRYKDGSGSWQSSGSFGRNEIPLAIYCLIRAFATMAEEQEGRESIDQEVIE